MNTRPEECQKLLDALSDLITGTAPAETVAWAAAHRKVCAECDAEWLLADRVELGLGSLAQFSSKGLLEAFNLRLAQEKLDPSTASTPESGFDPTGPVDLGLRCDEFREMLDDIAANVAPEGLAEEAAEHAMTCADCDAELKHARRLEYMLRSLPHIDPPAEKIWSRLVTRIETDTARSRPARRSRRRAARTSAGPVLRVLGS